MYDDMVKQHGLLWLTVQFSLFFTLLPGLIRCGSKITSVSAVPFQFEPMALK